MRPALETTSVPTWATSTVRPDADLSGRHWTVVAIGTEAEDIAASWRAQIVADAPLADIRVHRVVDDRAAQAAVTADIVAAVVGWRLMIAGPAHACLRVRAHALQCGVADDEITVASTAVAIRDVRCALCGTVTSAEMNLGDLLPCSGCSRNVVVHHHVSRRLGAHLGFMADAGDP
ncbi:dimethylamine monooxygenase subunit DmmA family protein [soil metagenome]